jgi:uncharacterized protein (TIGR00251 family)
VHVQPGAARTEVVGHHGARLKLRVHGPPSEGRANAALCSFLAQEFAVARTQVTLVSGSSSREKTVCIDAPKNLPPWLRDECS